MLPQPQKQNARHSHMTYVIKYEMDEDLTASIP
jgi:hypothetical protein